MTTTVESQDVIERRRRRVSSRWLVVAAAVLTAGVIAATNVPHWLGDRAGLAAGEAPPPAGGAGLHGGPPPLGPAAGSASFDPMRRVIGYVSPTGLRIAEYATARYWQSVTFEDDARTLAVEVRAYPRGHAGMFFAPQGRVEPASGVPTEPVGGAPAYWLPDGQRHFQYEAVRLAWQSAGGWVFATAASTDDQGRRPKVSADELRALARRVAEQVRIDLAGPPVTMPFTVPAPSGQRLTGSHLLLGKRLDGTPISRATLSFGVTDEQNPGISRAEPGRNVSVTAALNTSPDDKPGSANRTVDGHPVAEYDGGAILYGAGEGYAVEVTGAGVDLARTVRILPGARSESAWTDSPVR